MLLSIEALLFFVFYDIINSPMSRSVIVHVWRHVFNDRIYAAIDSISEGIFHLVWSGLPFLLCLFRLFDTIANFRFSPHFKIMLLLLGFINLVSNILEMLVSQSNNYFFILFYFVNCWIFFILFFVPFSLCYFLVSTQDFRSTRVSFSITYDSANEDMITLFDSSMLF